MGIWDVVRGAYFPLPGEVLRHWKGRMDRVLAPRGYRFAQPSTWTRRALRARQIHAGCDSGLWQRQGAPSLVVSRHVAECPQGGSPLEILYVSTSNHDPAAHSPSHAALYRALVAAGVLHAVGYSSGGATRPSLLGDAPAGWFTRFAAAWQSSLTHYWGAPDAVRLLLLLDEAESRRPSQGHYAGLDRTLLDCLNLLGCPELVQRWEVGRVRRELARDPRFAPTASPGIWERLIGKLVME